MEKRFIRDFHKMMVERRRAFSFTLADLPLPKIDDKVGLLGYKKLYQVEGLGFKNPVVLLGQKTYKRKVVLSDGKPLVDTKGEEVKKTVSLSTDEVLVASLEYVDMECYLGQQTESGLVVYFYKVDPSKLYAVNLTVMYISKSKMSNFYKGYKVALQTGDYIYIYITPFNVRDVYKTSTTLTRMLVAVKVGLDYTEELNLLYEEWSLSGLLFDNDLGEVVGNTGEVYNLMYEELPPVLDELNYEVVSNKSLVQESEKEELVYGD